MDMLSRVSGSLVAAVVGDCIGAVFEGTWGRAIGLNSVLKEIEQIEKAYETRKKLRTAEGKASTVLRQHEFTDDTAMARSIAASLVENKACDLKDIAKRFAEEFKKEPARGYGANVGTVLDALADPKLDNIFRPASEQFNGSGSYGNGGAMRIAPLGLFCHNSDFLELKKLSTDVTRLTHTHPNGIIGAVLESRAVQLALSLDNTKPLDTTHFLDTLLSDMRSLEDEVFQQEPQMQRGQQAEDGKSQLPSYCDKLEIIREFLTRDVDKEEVDEKLGTDISAIKSVPTAVYCFLRGSQKSVAGIKERNEVEQTIIYAISLGGDTDTIATMAGAIAGAFYGLDMVPEAWQEACEGVLDAKSYAEGIAKLVEKS